MAKAPVRSNVASGTRRTVVKMNLSDFINNMRPPEGWLSMWQVLKRANCGESPAGSMAMRLTRAARAGQVEAVQIAHKWYFKP